MGRVPAAGEDAGHGGPFFQGTLPPSLFPGRPPEHGADFEEPHVPTPVRPVVLHPSYQARQQAAAEVRLLGRQRVQHRDGVGPVGGAQGKRTRLVQPGPRQPLAHPRARALLGRVGYGPRPVGPQLVGERVIAREPRDLFDQVDVARHVGAPPGHLDREPLLLGRHEEPDRREVPLDVGARDRHAEQPGDALGAEEHRALLERLGPEVERRLAQLTARHRDDELDRAPQRVRHGQHVDAPLEAVARLARQLERPSGTADARRLEVGALDHQVGRGRAHLGLRAPHDPRHDRRPLGVADRRHLRRQGARDAVEGHDLLGRPGAPHHDRGPPQLCEIERVQRLVQLEQDVVRRVHHVVDRPLTDGGQPTREPGGALPHPDSPDDGDHVARGALGVL